MAGLLPSQDACFFLIFFYLILPWSFQTLLYFSILLCSINNSHHSITAEIAFTLSQRTVSKRHLGDANALGTGRIYADLFSNCS